MLQSEKLRAKAAQVKMLNPTRCSKVPCFVPNSHSISQSINQLINQSTQDTEVYALHQGFSNAFHAQQSNR